MNILLRKAKTLLNILKFRLMEKKWGGVSYIHYKTGSNALLICFSAFPPTDLRVYNNIRGFKDLKVDRLYIKDSWGFRGSYYLYENGKSYPYDKTSKFIKHILEKYQYSKVYTAGTSKGGSCAIIYGLKYNANHIFSGACQYRIGNWLNVPEHTKILNRMRGPVGVNEMVDSLNEFMPNLISGVSAPETTVHIVYSKKEHTYEEHLIELFADLRDHNIEVVEKECYFEDHKDVGYSFVPYVVEWFENNAR